MKIIFDDYKGNLDRFIDAYKMILIESVNYSVNDGLVNDILSKIDNKCFSYSVKDLQQFDIKIKNVSLTIVVSTSNNVRKDLSKFNIKFSENKISEIEKELKQHYAIIEDTTNKHKFLFINDNITNKDLLKHTLRHELTHLLESDELKNKWYDLLPKNPKEIENTMIYQMLSLIGLKLNMNYSQFYYLASAKEFESYCTCIEDNKKNIDKNLANNFLKSIFTEEFDELSSTLKLCYVFIFLNLALDKDKKERISYLRQHL